MTPSRLEVSRDARGVVAVALARPDVRNAFDDVLIAEATEIFRVLDGDTNARVVVLSGQGKAFCAGADLAWMARMVSYGIEENRRDAAALAEMLRAIDGCRKPVVGRVHGAALGGGTGLAAACDVVVAAAGTLFGTTEVRLGIVPAVISPYVVRKLGESRAREWFLTGERWDAEEARCAGLVHRVVPESELDAAVASVVDAILAGGPEAVAEAKRLARLAGELPLEAAIPRTVDSIAARRVSPEGQEGMRAFLEKRKPAWTHE
ncbi:MAG TPA: enoyl-CoA hydratase-related protein [Thermoanaerobaculia bacterium]|nr:enoyl-CoA hydratase-related protein [Thermoanaerobaculia bacterium]